jgi:hypothetical protein
MKSFSSQSAPESKSMQLMDYSERKLFIGIDVHKTRWQVAVLCEGIVLSNASIAASADELIAHLHKHYAGADYQIVYECGAWGFTLCRQLWAAGMECMLVNPSDIPGTDRERRSKTDPIDARRMACVIGGCLSILLLFLEEGTKFVEYLFCRCCQKIRPTPQW